MKLNSLRQLVREELKRTLDSNQLNEVDWFDYLPDHPARQSDDNIRKGYEPKESPFTILANTGESAIFERDGKLYYFYYDVIDRDDFEEYADRQIISVEPDGEGGYDEELDDEWEMNDDVISNYLNDNYSKLEIGKGLNDYEEGKEFLEIDEPLKNEILSIFKTDDVKKALDKLK